MPTFTSHRVPECPYVTTQGVFSGKWSMLLLHHMEEGPIRFNELHRRLTGISQATASIRRGWLDDTKGLCSSPTKSGV